MRFQLFSVEVWANSRVASDLKLHHTNVTWVYNTLQWRHKGAMASQITSVSIIYSAVCSDADRRKHQNSASLAFVRGIHRWPLNSPHKGPVPQEMFPFDGVIMIFIIHSIYKTNISECVDIIHCILRLYIYEWSILYIATPKQRHEKENYVTGSSPLICHIDERLYKSKGDQNVYWCYIMYIWNTTQKLYRLSSDRDIWMSSNEMLNNK